MIKLKFIDRVLHQSIRFSDGKWTDYHPVPSEKYYCGCSVPCKPKEKTLVEKFMDLHLQDRVFPNLYEREAKELARIATEHFTTKP